MTIDQAKNKLVLTATAELGTREGPNNWNRYAAMPEMTQLLGWNAQNQPWCNVYVNACFIKAFGLKIGAAMIYQPIGGGSVLCSTSADFFKAAGAWIPRGRTPDPGDVFFKLINGKIDHMGIVTRVTGGSVITVEGNSSDMVAERVYSVQDSSIAGYGRPRWALAAEIEQKPGADEQKPGEPEQPAPMSCKPELPILRNGDTGPAVAALQMALRYRRYDPRWVDGEFGPRTEQQLKAFQKAAGIVPDGVCGEKTYSALFKG